MRVGAFVLVVVLSACGSIDAGSPAPTPAASVWINKSGMVACGNVRAYVAATPTAVGVLEIGSRKLQIAAGTAHVGNLYPVEPGKAMCVWGGLDGQPSQDAGAEPLAPWLCGRVRAFTPPGGATGYLELLEYWTWGVISLPIPAGTPLASAMPFDSYRCITSGLDPVSGDVVVRGDTDGLADVDLHCGAVRSFQPPTAAIAGSITVGSRTIPLPAGARYQRDPAGMPTDTTAVGKVLCFRAVLDDANDVRRYGPHLELVLRLDPTGHVPAICGRAFAFKAPTAKTDGQIALSLNGALLRIPAGTTLPVAPECVKVQLDASGDLTVMGGATPSPMRL